MQTQTRFAVAVILAAALGAGASAQAASRSGGPNVLLVFADQMRAAAMGCMGNPQVKTPNLDRLAAGGALLSNCHSTDPVCTPFRAMMLTGRFGFHTGVMENDVALPFKEISLAEAFKGAGYATGFIGKWHLSAGRKAKPGTPEKAGFVPPGEARQGFDFWRALECSHEYFDTRYFADEPTPIPVHGYEPQVQTDLAIGFIKEHRGEPFCLVMSWGPPHNPYTPPKEWDIYDPSQIKLRPNVPEADAALARKQIAQYYGLVSSLDHQMGRLLDTLAELQIERDTIVVFTSDHGDMLESQGWTLKQKPWSEASNTPFILRYPAKVGAGRKRDLLLSTVDIMPTVLGMCGVKGPAAMDGVDLSPVLRGESGEEPESIFLYNQPHTGNNVGASWRAVRTKRYLYAVTNAGDWLLYDVLKDPYELHNLAGDPSVAPDVAHLRGLLTDWRRKADDELNLEGEVRTPGGKGRKKK